MNPPRNVGSVQDCRLRKDGFRNAFFPAQQNVLRKSENFQSNFYQVPLYSIFLQNATVQTENFSFFAALYEQIFLFSQKAVPEFTKTPFFRRKIKRQRNGNLGFYATLR